MGIYTFPRIEKYAPVQAKRYVLEKKISRADETPTFESGFVGRKLGRQQKVSKTQCCFSMFFCPIEFASTMWQSRWSPELENRTFS